MPPKEQPSTPTRSGSAKQQGKEDASKGSAADKKEGKSIQDTAVYGEIVQNLVGLHEFGKEAAAARQDGDVQTGGIKEPIADAKKKEKKAPAGGAAAVKPKAGSDASKDRDATDKGEGPKRKSNGRTGKKNLSSDCVSTLKEWYDKHTDWPYPATSDKVELAKKTGMQEETVNNWFINARKRLMNAKDREKLVMGNPAKKARAEAMSTAPPPAKNGKAAKTQGPADAAEPSQQQPSAAVAVEAPSPVVQASTVVQANVVGSDVAPPTGGMKD